MIRIISAFLSAILIASPAIAISSPLMLQIIGHGAPTAPSGATDYTQDANCMGAWFMNAEDAETDRSGEGGTLSETGSAARSGDVRPPGYNGYSRYFLSTGYLTHADGGATDISGADQPITVAAWINLDGLSVDKHIMSHGNLTTSAGFAFYIESTDSTVRFRLSSDGSASVVAYSAATVSIGTWAHVAAVYNDTDIRIYVNGALSTNGSYNPLTYSSGVFNNNYVFGIGVCGSNYFTGYIDEAIVFNRALSAAEILELYETGISGDTGGSD